MASIKGVSLKKIQHPMGREGYNGLIADVYLGKKKIGTYCDYADGAMGNMENISDEDMEKLMHIVFAYANENPSQYILNLYEKEPERIEKEKEGIRKYMPYITEEEMTLNALSAADYDILISEVDELTDYEKRYKKMLKKGYPYMGVLPNKSAIHFTEEIKEETMAKNTFDMVFTSLDDFNL